MSQRSKREMEVLAAKLKDHIGPVEKWSADALTSLTRWLADYHIELSQELARRESEALPGLTAVVSGKPQGNMPEASVTRLTTKRSSGKKSGELFGGSEV